MMAAVLLGALALGSCVDDNESASVTAIRDAKAAQLSALANYQQAQADAELILANAEAKVKEADAAYQAALAKIKDLQAQEKELELQKAQATLETDIEAAKTKAQAQLIQAQAKLEAAKAALITASDAVDLATKAKVQNLITSANAVMYGGAYYIFDKTTGTYVQAGTIDTDKSLIGDDANPGLKLQLIEVNANLVTAQYDLEDTKIKIQQYVEAEKAELAQNEALLKAYNDNKTTDREEAKKAYDEAVKALPAYQNAKDETQKAYTVADNASDEAYDALYSSELAAYLSKTIDDPDYSNSYTSIYNWLDRWGIIDFNYSDREYETVNITYDDGTYSSRRLYYGEKYVIDEDIISEKITEAERDLAIKKDLLADAQKTYNDGIKTDNPTYKAYLDAVKAAQDAFNDDPSYANESALETAESNLKNYLNGIEGPLNRAKESVEDAQAYLDLVKEVQTKLTGDVFKAYLALYDAYAAVFKETVDPYIAKEKAIHNYYVQSNLISSLGSIINNYTDWTTVIEGVEAAIRENNKNIAAMTDNGNTTDSSSAGETEASRQAYIDALTVEKAALEQEIAVKQAQYDDYMKQVEALIGGGSTETPAE